MQEGRLLTVRFLEHQHGPQPDRPDAAGADVDPELLHRLYKQRRVLRVKRNVRSMVEIPTVSLIPPKEVGVSPFALLSTHPRSLPRRFWIYDGCAAASFSSSE